MVKINLSTYEISIINTQRKEKIFLDNITYDSLHPEENPKSLMEILFRFFSEKKSKNEDFKKDYKLLEIRSFNTAEDNIFFGEFSYGTYGTEHNIKNINDQNKENQKLNKDQSVLTPYYFYIEIPSHRKDGLVILESKGNAGIKILFEEWLDEFINKSSHTNLKLELKKFLPKKTIDTYLNKGFVKRLRFLSYRLPTDELEILDGYEPEEGYVELKIHINKENRKLIKESMKSLLRNKNDEAKKYKNVMGDNLETDDIKLEVDLNGSERTFTIDNLENAVPTRDITDELENGEDGHRTFESIHEKGKEYANDILRS